MSTKTPKTPPRPVLAPVSNGPWFSREAQYIARERDVMAYLASIIGPTGNEDGGPGMDTLQNWLYRVAVLTAKLKHNKDSNPT